MHEKEKTQLLRVILYFPHPNFNLIHKIPHKNIDTKKSSYFRNCLIFLRDPGGARTHDLRLRRPLLYPTELLDQNFSFLAVQR